MLIPADPTAASQADIADDPASPDIAMALPRPAAFSPCPPPENDGGLLDAVEASTEDRVLVVGGATAELLCASLRRGCRGAMGVAAPPAHPEAAEVVVAPRVASLEQAEAIACCARKALRHGRREGRLAMRILGVGPARLARHLVARLQALGYARLRLRRGQGQALVITGRFAALLPSA